MSGAGVLISMDSTTFPLFLFYDILSLPVYIPWSVITSPLLHTPLTPSPFLYYFLGAELHPG